MRLLLFLMFGLLFESVASADDGKVNSASFLEKLAGKHEDFSELKRIRRKMVREIDAAEREIRNLEAEIEQLSRGLEDAPRELQFLKFKVENASSRISKLKEIDKTAGNPGKKEISAKDGLFSLNSDSDDPAVWEGRKSELETRIREIENKQQRLKVSESELKGRRETLSIKQNELLDLEDRIGNALSTGTNQYIYRTVISLVFAVIVFSLVLKFFVIVENNEAVKQSIFSGEAGIQFITLFSIVIAVILFGILDILGANELSALLGGLSGYILGKSAPRGKLSTGDADSHG
ncbi:hypothetical protein SAMN05518865_1413 [Duganella sp. CF458]|uniref:hypothetical protein n=1 Tax=Duganella sp. CF458 TaxID=1884368 RepID=UPI0008EA7F10|nr:hypothetical protein [Duganella sp. CF458]SFH04155.1 hypothetical protein SAMN05518865_1413 [Duganella sp. CF458]